MKKVVLTLAVFIFVALGAGLWILPPLVEARMNRIDGSPQASISAPARRLHRRLLVTDLHADTLLWNRDLLQRNRRGHVDIPRLVEGNVAVQAFTVVTEVPRRASRIGEDAGIDLIRPLAILQRWPIRTWSSLTERALYQARRFDEAVSRSKGTLVRVRNSGDLKAYLERRQNDSAITAAFLGIEGAQALDEDLRNLDVLFSAGFRMMSPTHFGDNPFAGSASGIARGLTAKGRELVKQMEARHMIIDLAHSSPRTIADVLAIATRPVLVSHTGVRATCDSERNLTDGQVRSIATAGGLIGIAYFQGAVCGTDVRAIVKAIRHVSRIVGVEHVALGSDFDGATRMPFDTAGLVHVTDALLADGFTEPEVAMIMGGNAIRFLGANLP